MSSAYVPSQHPVQSRRQRIEQFQRQARSAIFPIQDHSLYRSADSFEQLGFLLPQDLANFTHDNEFQGDVTQLEICPTCFFQTSGTTSRSKRIPYSADDLERQKQHEAQAFRMAGMTPKDVVMTLGSPLPSISGWATIHGSEAVGASVANTSQLDYEDVFLRKMEKKISFVFATPIVAMEIGRQIEKDHGPLREVFPNLRVAVIFGDVLPDSLRRSLKELWGFQRVISLYGTVEADVVAVECFESPGRQHPMIDRLTIEVIPEDELARERAEPGYQPKAVNILNVKQDTIGEIVISDLVRDILPLLRYRIGDIVKVSPADCGCDLHGPTVSVLGRARNVVYLGGVPLYEMQINAALEHALGAAMEEWRLVRNAEDPSTYTLYVAGDRARLDGAALQRAVSAVQHARPELSSIEVGRYIAPMAVERLEQVPIKGDAKARRIVLD